MGDAQQRQGVVLRDDKARPGLDSHRDDPRFH